MEPDAPPPTPSARAGAKEHDWSSSTSRTRSVAEQIDVSIDFLARRGDPFTWWALT